MGKTGYITARVEPKLKAQAARVLARVGVSTTDAITMFSRAVPGDGLPFDARVPDAETQEAIAELESADRRTKLAKCDVPSERLGDLVPSKRKRETPGERKS